MKKDLKICIDRFSAQLHSNLSLLANSLYGIPLKLRLHWSITGRNMSNYNIVGGNKGVGIATFSCRENKKKCDTK